MRGIRWTTKHFDHLNTDELYKILRLRSQVFVVEQRCVFLDNDNYDRLSYHTMGWINHRLIATSRLFDYEQMYTDKSIGRVVCDPEYRHEGTGKELMSYSMRESDRLFGKGIIQIGAQYRLLGFYEKFGFQSFGVPYDEDGIDHIAMIYFPKPEN